MVIYFPCALMVSLRVGKGELFAVFTNWQIAPLKCNYWDGEVRAIAFSVRDFKAGRGNSKVFSSVGNGLGIER